MRSIYPKAFEDRQEPWAQIRLRLRRHFLPAVAKNFLLLQVLFLSLFCWVFGALYQQNSHVHNLTVGFVDYDGGAVGAAFRTAYAKLQGDGYPTIAEYPPRDFPSPADLDDAVCRADLWATLYIAPGASARLRDALAGASPAAGYNRTGVASYTWNEARYPAVVDAAIASNLVALSAAAKIAYATANATVAGMANSADPAAALAILVEPWQLESFNIQPTSQGSRAIYNTLVIVLILIQEFFYLGTVNGIYGQLKIWTKGRPLVIFSIRLANSLAYTLIGSVCTTGAIWAFRSGWDVDGARFVLVWLTLWLFGHLNFQVLDVFTVWLPLPYVPMALISWVMLNVASILLPFELSPAFFKIGYMFPSHAVYQTLLDIWSRGCNPVLDYSLTTMFAWELVATALSTVGIYRRCHYGRLAAEREEAQFNERLNAAVQFERQREGELREKGPRRGRAAEPSDGEINAADSSSQAEAEEVEEEAMKNELATVISGVNSRIRHENMKRRASTATNFGPSFSLPFDCGDDEDDD